MKEKEIQKNGRSPFKLRKIKVEKPIRKKKETEIYESNYNGLTFLLHKKFNPK